MKELVVGDYVRINNDFRSIALGIGKVVKINKDNIYVKMNLELPFSFKKENIAKHSKQLIDLIEVGDIVNDMKVLDIHKPRDLWEPIEIKVDSKYTNFILAEDIKTILTKEQYVTNCYKVGGKYE